MRKNFVLAIIISLFVILALTASCSNPEKPAQPPVELPPGIQVDKVPETADLLFVSMRYVLRDLACLDENYLAKDNFLNDPECMEKIYNEDLNVLASPRQLYALDIDSGEAVQLTNLDCDFSGVKPIDESRLMAAGMCADTDGDGLISTLDKPEVYLLDLGNDQVSCLTCEFDLRAINNPDYSIANELILFSAQRVDKFHNYLFTLDLNQNLTQITTDDNYMDFDCSWSEDGTKIVFSRLPTPFFDLPSQVWLIDANGSNQEKITDGGPNLANEDPHGPYPIGIDADPDLSPDNSQIVFSRLRTGMENEPFGVYELVVIDVSSGEITILDSSFANMIPEWKEEGILLIRQIGSSTNVMDRKQAIYLYQNGLFKNLEPDFEVFPIGSNGASWIE
jgi:Tol biopolymer transport system component